MRQILIKVLIGVLVVAIVATGGYFVVTKFILNKNNTPETPSSGGGTNVYTNRYNDAIISKKLTTGNYSGTYKYNSIVGVTFNKYDSEKNPKGLNDYDIERLIELMGITGGIPAFNAHLGETKRNNVEESGELLTIITPVGAAGQPSSYALFTKSENGSITNGKVYGDENLALVTFEDKSNDNMLISLNYTSVENAVGLVGEAKTKPQTIYVFVDVYSTNQPGYRLFTITYEYTLQEEDTNHPDVDLGFDKDKI